MSFLDLPMGAVSVSDLVVTVLTSGAIGGAAGGVITSRMRGRIERDEAWRTRLVEASDSFLAQLDRTRAVPYGWAIAQGMRRSHKQ